MKDIPETERPRERLLLNGTEALSDAELLAIVIGSGRRDLPAIDLARVIITEAGGVSGLVKKDHGFFRQFKGIGAHKGATIHAVVELARRMQQPGQEEPAVITSPEDVARMFVPRLKGIIQERFFVILLNSANRMIKTVEISRGILNTNVVHPREVFRAAILDHAAAVIVVHNHPSGNPEPSAEDIAITKQLVESGKIMGIPVHDHLIIADAQFTSFAQRNLI